MGNIARFFQTSGEFRPDWVSLSLQVPAGVTGDVLTLTPPAGKRVALFLLMTTSPQSGISIAVGSTNFVTDAILDDTGLTSGCFRIGPDGTVDKLVAKEKDTLIYVRKNAGNTTVPIHYVWGYGD